MPDSIFPEQHIRQHGFLDVGDGHSVYWEECGNPEGIPVIFLHGGPGAGVSPFHRRFFDPHAYRVILFDQRGSGRSTPRASIKANTTQHLIRDIETIREMLGIERWMIFGGSWGSTLALAYGQTHPERCLAFILRGIFLGRENEIDWFLYGMGTFFPEVWRQFADHVPEAGRQDLLGAYLKLLTDPDPDIHLPAAQHWARYEAACCSLTHTPTLFDVFNNGSQALSVARLEAHYFNNKLFLPAEGLLAGMDRLRHLPAAIIQGRYDMVCPPTSADALARVWPRARLEYVPNAGHAVVEPGIQSALIRATERFKYELSA